MVPLFESPALLFFGHLFDHSAVFGAQLGVLTGQELHDEITALAGVARAGQAFSRDGNHLLSGCERHDATALQKWHHHLTAEDPGPKRDRHYHPDGITFEHIV